MATSQDVVLLTEAVRQRIGSQICRQYQSSEGELEYVGLDEQVDQIIRSASRKPTQANLSLCH